MQQDIHFVHEMGYVLVGDVDGLVFEERIDADEQIRDWM
jgi:hypothetical protein